MKTDFDPLNRIITTLGLQRTAQVCGVSITAVWKWRQRGRLPRTDLTGETRYSQLLASASSDISEEALLEATRRAWQQRLPSSI